MRRSRAGVASALLFSISLALVLVSNVSYVEPGGTKDLDIVAGCGISLVKVGLGGIVRARGEIPVGIRVYLLEPKDYLIYEKSGSLPEKFLDSGDSELEVRNPVAVLVENPTCEDKRLTLYLEVYLERRPYTLLALPSYALAVLALTILLVWMSEKLKEIGGGKSSEI